MKIWIGVSLLFIVGVSFFPVYGSAETTYTDITIVSDQNVTANVTAVANGTAVVYVDGVPIKTEISKIWKQLKSINGKAYSAWRIGNDAWLLALNNNESIMFLYDKVDNNTMKIYLLHDELLGFENEYLSFKNSSKTSFENLNSSVNANADRFAETVSMLSMRLDFVSKIVVVLLVTWFVTIVGVVVSDIVKKHKAIKIKKVVDNQQTKQP